MTYTIPLTVDDLPDVARAVGVLGLLAKLPQRAVTLPAAAVAEYGDTLRELRRLGYLNVIGNSAGEWHVWRVK